MTPDEARERVTRGAALLDAEMPDWFSRIDVGTLDLRLCGNCVLGQLEGAFGEAARRRWGAGWYGHAEAHGFTPPMFSATWPEDCRLLQDAWIAAIADRVVAVQQVYDEAQDADVIAD